MKITHILLVLATTLLIGCKSAPQNYQNKVEPELEQIKTAAKKLYNDLAVKNEDALNIGPCLGIINGEWAVDIVHQPRISIDNLPENNCQDYQKGKVKHLIEFNTRGQIITIK